MVGPSSIFHIHCSKAACSTLPEASDTGLASPVIDQAGQKSEVQSWQLLQDSHFGSESGGAFACKQVTIIYTA